MIKPVKCQCGREPGVYQLDPGNEWVVGCFSPSCFLWRSRGPFRKTKDGAIMAWNRERAKKRQKKEAR